MSRIQQIFFLPPMATARLGGSDIPLDSFTWVEDPTLHGAGLTVIAPTTSLEVLQDGSVRPFLPTSIQFRDGAFLRPVAPFFELWAQLEGETDIKALTTALLEECGGSVDGVTFTVTASNHKAARRTGDPACAFTARIEVLGNDYNPHPLLASSLGDQPLVFPQQPIPLGQFQVIRPVTAQALNLDLSVLRVRFTPKLTNETVYFAYFPLNDSAHIHHVFERVKFEYALKKRWKAGVGYAGVKFPGVPWVNKPLITTTISTRAGAFEFWLQRIPGGEQVEIRYALIHTSR